MNTNPECDRVRTHQMARLDGEDQALAEADRTHMATCASCQHWLAGLEALTARFLELGYPEASKDLWTPIAGRISLGEPISPMPHRLWLIGGAALGVRGLQLVADFQIPALQLLVPLAAAVVIAAVWKVAGGALSIETWAPELRKGDV